MKLFVVALLVGTVGAAQTRVGAESAKTPIERLRSGEVSAEVISALKTRGDDPQVIPSLRDAFARARATPNSVETSGITDFKTSQYLALTLIQMGVHDDALADELMKYARVAINADPPEMFQTDSEGRETLPLSQNPVFDRWCAERNFSSTSCQRLFLTYGADLGWIVVTRDVRSIPVLRDALGMKNSVMVMVAVRGLAALNDSASLPLIARACARFPAVQAEMIAASAVEFTDPAVQGLFLRFARDEAKRIRLKADWERYHAKEVTK